MRKVVLTLVVLLLGSVPALAQSQEWPNKMFLAQGGEAKYDFGNVARGAQRYHRFQMTNIWAVPIEILEIRASCGCVAAVPTTRILQPRETAFLDVTMDARRFTGPKTVSIYVTIGPEYTGTATVQVSAVSRPDVVFNPGEVNFGVVAAGQSPTQVIDVEYAGAIDWRVSEVISNGAPLDVKIEELYRQPGQVGYRLKVTLKPDAPPATHKWEVSLKTNDPASPSVPVLVEATVQAPLTVVPGNLVLKGLKVGELTTQRVVVRSEKPFKVTAIDGLGDGIDVELPTAPAKIQILTIKCQPSQAGDLHRQLHIKTDLESEAPVVVTIDGTVAS